MFTTNPRCARQNTPGPAAPAALQACGILSDPPAPASQRGSRLRRWPQSKSPPGSTSSSRFCACTIELCRLRGRLRPLQQPQQRFKLRLDRCLGRRGRGVRPASGPRARSTACNYAAPVERLQQIIHRVDVECPHRVLVVCSCKHKLRQRLRVSLSAFGPLRSISLLDHCKSIQPRHLHIKKHQVGVVLLNQVTASMPFAPCAITSTPPTWSSR